MVLRYNKTVIHGGKLKNKWIFALKYGNENEVRKKAHFQCMRLVS